MLCFDVNKCTVFASNNMTVRVSVRQMLQWYMLLWQCWLSFEHMILHNFVFWLNIYDYQQTAGSRPQVYVTFYAPTVCNASEDPIRSAVAQRRGRDTPHQGSNQQGSEHVIFIVPGTYIPASINNKT